MLTGVWENQTVLRQHCYIRVQLTNSLRILHILTVQLDPQELNKSVYESKQEQML